MSTIEEVSIWIDACADHTDNLEKQDLYRTKTLYLFCTCFGTAEGEGQGKNQEHHRTICNQYCTGRRLWEGPRGFGVPVPLRDPRDPSAPCAKHVKQTPKNEKTQHKYTQKNKIVNEKRTNRYTTTQTNNTQQVTKQQVNKSMQANLKS